MKNIVEKAVKGVDNTGSVKVKHLVDETGKDTGMVPIYAGAALVGFKNREE